MGGPAAPIPSTGEGLERPGRGGMGPPTSLSGSDPVGAGAGRGPC
jgi:hypothetical protein